MKSLTESPAVLSIHSGAAGQYILRIADLRHRPLLVAVSKLLGDARSLVVITPTDVKVFEVGGTDSAMPAVAEPGPASDPADEGPAMSDAELARAIAEQEGHAVPGSVRSEPESVVPPSGAEVVGETSQGTKVVRRRKADPVAGHDEPCGRCQGQGKIHTLMEGGTPATAACPVCKGAGVMRRYGARR